MHNYEQFEFLLFGSEKDGKLWELDHLEGGTEHPQSIPYMDAAKRRLLYW